MKEYVKPDVFVTEFRLNSTIAGCDPTTINPDEQDIKCTIVSGEAHNVFYNNCRTNATQAGRLKEYNGTTYFIWYDEHFIGKPSAEAERLITALGVQQGEHAGIANAEIISIVNSSY